MTNTERVGIWFVVVALVGMAFIWWAALNKRIDDVSPVVTSAFTAPPTTTTPLATEVANLRRAVLELQATRGLSGPEVRELVETLLPAPQNPPTDEPCAEPPCTSTTVGPATPPTASTPPGSTTTTTTEKRRRRR